MKLGFSFISYLRNIDYIEVLPIIIAVIVIAIENLHHVFALIPLAIVALLVIAIFFMDYYRYDNSFMAYTSVGSAGFMAGYRLDIIIAFVMISLVFIRIVKSPSNNRMQLIMLSIITCLIGIATLFLIQISNNASIDEIYQIILLCVFSSLVILDYVNMNISSLILLQQNETSKQRIKEMVNVTNSLSRFLPDQIRQPIIQEKEIASLFNKRTKITLFFSDIVGFTDLSDNISADTLTDILNVYMDRMTLVAQRHGGVLDKFIGDGMMCFFGADNKKYSIQESATACVAMALDMRREMRDLRQLWRDQGHDLHLRIGINTGYCHVGNFGSENRMSYTAIGKEVNLAARLEGAAGIDEIIVSQSTFEYISYEYTCEMVGDIKLKGFESLVRCYRVLDKPTSELKRAQWVDHDLPGFNLHLNFKDIKSYDYNEIRKYLHKAIERVDSVEETKK